MKSSQSYYLSPSKIRARQAKLNPVVGEIMMTHSQYQLPSTSLNYQNNNNSEYGTDQEIRPIRTFENRQKETFGLKPLNPIRNVPKHFITDKEDLYQELQQQKRHNNEDQLTIRNLKTSNSYLKHELQKFQGMIIPNENEYTMSTQQEIKFTPTQKSSINFHLQSHKGSEINNLFQYKNRIVENPKKDLQSSQVQQLENENKALQLLCEELQLRLANLLGSGGEAIDILKQDYVEMANLIKTQQIQINDGQNKCLDQNKKFICLQIKYKGLKKLQQEQQIELTKLKERDNAYLIQQDQKKSKEKQLIRQQELLQMEMNKQEAVLSVTQSRLLVTEKRMKDALTDANEQIHFIEKELHDYKEKFLRLKEEVDQDRYYPSQKAVNTLRKQYSNDINQRKSLQIINFNNNQQDDSLGKNSPLCSSTGNRQSQLYRINEEHVQSHRSGRSSFSGHLVVMKQPDLNYLAKLLKYRLISLRIDLKDIDQFLFSSENIRSDTVSSSDLRNNLQNHIFGIFEESHLICLARYLTDQDEETISVSVARARSIFKTLVDNYTIPDVNFANQILDQEEQIQIVEDTILKAFDKHRYDFMNYIARKQPASNGGQYLVKDLIESFTAFDVPLTKQHVNHLIAYLYTKFNDITYFKLESLTNLFNQEQKSQQELKLVIQNETINRSQIEDPQQLSIPKSRQDIHQLDISQNPFAIDDLEDFLHKQHDEHTDVEFKEFKMVDSQRLKSRASSS